MKITQTTKEIISKMSKAQKDYETKQAIKKGFSNLEEWIEVKKNLQIEVYEGIIHTDGDLNQLEKSLRSYLVRKNDEYRFFWSIPDKYGEEGCFKTNILKVWDELNTSLQVKDTFVHQLNLNDYGKEQETYLTAVADVNNHNKYQFQYRQKFDDSWVSFMGSLERINMTDVPKGWLDMINKYFLFNGVE